MFEHIIDERLSLRTLHIQDADELFAVVDANRAYLRQWLPWLDANTAPEHTRAFIQSTLDQCARNEGFACAILHDGKIVGTAGYHPIKWNSHSVEIGYWLAEAYTGRGIITQCCRVLIEHAFIELKLHKVLIPVAEENHKSRAIPEQLGFKNEGVLRNAERLYDRYVNHVIYSLSFQDWNH
jgi:ribosomal-protein-serine acetyltransferase